MKIYIAGPLFNEIETERNRQLKKLLIGWGFDTYLPQEDGGISYDLIESGTDAAQTRKKIFNRDMAEIKHCDILLCILDGRVPDEGMCLELGAAYMLGKKCIGYHTDQRAFDKFGINLMIEGCLASIAHSTDELRQMLQ